MLHPSVYHMFFIIVAADENALNAFKLSNFFILQRCVNLSLLVLTLMM